MIINWPKKYDNTMLIPAVFKIADSASPINIRKVNTPLTTERVPNPTNRPKTIDKPAKTDISDVQKRISVMFP